MMKEANRAYTLYLDESKMRIGDKNEMVYAVAGIIIYGPQIHQIRSRLKDLKLKVWNIPDKYSPAPAFRSIHQTEVRNPSVAVIKKLPYMQVFRSRTNQSLVFSGIGSIIDDFDLPILGAVINEKRLQSDYGSHQDSYTAYYAALKMIIEEFALFLHHHDGQGKLIFESRANAQGNVSDQRVRKTFYKILTNGTIRYSAIELQQLIYGVTFIKKSQNDAGIQIADYVPRAFLYSYCGLSQPKPSIYQILRKHRYDGDSNQIDRFSRHGIIVIE